jgi:hypothetical protein
MEQVTTGFVQIQEVFQQVGLGFQQVCHQFVFKMKIAIFRHNLSFSNSNLI